MTLESGNVVAMEKFFFNLTITRVNENIQTYGKAKSPTKQLMISVEQ